MRLWSLQMAEAGFYYSGLSEEDDSATCFVCGKVLDGWERDDEPWKEVRAIFCLPSCFTFITSWFSMFYCFQHDKHAPNCKFVKMRKSESELSVSNLFTVKTFMVSLFYYKISLSRSKSSLIWEQCSLKAIAHTFSIRSWQQWRSELTRSTIVSRFNNFSSLTNPSISHS